MIFVLKLNLYKLTHCMSISEIIFEHNYFYFYFQKSNLITFINFESHLMAIQM